MHLKAKTSYYSRGLLEEAVAENKKKLTKEPKNHVLRCSLANGLSQLGEYEEAIKHFKICIKTDPSPEYWNNLGKALINTGEYKEAVAAFKEVQNLCNWPDAYYYQGIAYKSLGDTTNADKALKEAIKLNPKYREAINERALILEALDKKDEALIEYKKVIALFFSEYQSQEAEQYTYDTSVLLDNEELIEELIRQLKRYTQKFPGFADGHYKLGQALKARGMNNEAIMSFRKALEINPNYETARKSFWNK